MSSLELVRTRDELRTVIRERVAPLVERGDAALGLVPTMGALHGGHGELVAAARAANDLVVASVFVNPLQFDDPVDFARYPRDLDADLAILEAGGVDIVFAPATEEMYPGGTPMVTVSAGEMGRRLEGASRPGHFDGVVTVVAKLFALSTPPYPCRFNAYFGQKDAQQLAIIRRLAHDLDFGVTINPVPIVRTPEGLAMSSRNQLLTQRAASAALALSRALGVLRDRAAAGDPLNIPEVEAQVRADDLVELDYLEIVDPRTLRPIHLSSSTPGPALALIAARVDGIRLIDNMDLPGPIGTGDRATRKR